MSCPPHICACVAPQGTASGALPQKTTTFLKDIAKHNDHYIIVRRDLSPALYLTVSRHSLFLNLKLTSSARLAASQALQL